MKKKIHNIKSKGLKRNVLIDLLEKFYYDYNPNNKVTYKYIETLIKKYKSVGIYDDIIITYKMYDHIESEINNQYHKLNGSESSLAQKVSSNFRGTINNAIIKFNNEKLLNEKYHLQVVENMAIDLIENPYYQNSLNENNNEKTKKNEVLSPSLKKIILTLISEKIFFRKFISIKSGILFLKNLFNLIKYILFSPDKIINLNKKKSPLWISFILLFIFFRYIFLNHSLELTLMTAPLNKIIYNIKFFEILNKPGIYIYNLITITIIFSVLYIPVIKYTKLEFIYFLLFYEVHFIAFIVMLFSMSSLNIPNIFKMLLILFFFVLFIRNQVFLFRNKLK